MNRMNKFTNLINSDRTAIIKKGKKSKPAFFALLIVGPTKKTPCVFLVYGTI
jgi:hypothetical protein